MKARPKALTPLELEVMQVLWECAPATVQTVQQRLQKTRPLAYNTVQTVLTILLRKGKVKRSTGQRAHLFSPVTTRESTAAGALRDLVERLFGGRPEALVMSMVKDKQLTPAQIERLRKMLEEGEGDGAA